MQKSLFKAVAVLKTPDYITCDVWLFVELVVIHFLFVETRNISLGEPAAVLDGDEAQTQLA